MSKMIGKQSVKFDNPPKIIASASIAGEKEGKGLLKDYYDIILEDALWEESNWEKAESKLQKEVIKLAVKKSNRKMTEMRYIFGGDLLSQLIATSFAVEEFNIPLFGLYGACSTMGESIQLAAMSVDGGFSDYSIAVTSSHFCGAEKQFRYPLEFGSQRPLTATWTVTGSGSVVVAKQGNGPAITHITTGKIVDYGVKDSMNMGACMAPAAADTIYQHFQDLGISPDYYDVIATGDLGVLGKSLVKKLLKDKGLELGSNYTDCGVEVFSNSTQDTHSGGSGCGCAAITLCGYLLKKLKNKEINKLLIIPTGALLSQVSFNEGQSIPGIAHAVAIENID